MKPFYERRHDYTVLRPARNVEIRVLPTGMVFALLDGSFMPLVGKERTSASEAWKLLKPLAI